MALPITNFNTQAMLHTFQQPARPTPPLPKPDLSQEAPGSLVVIDSFVSSAPMGLTGPLGAVEAPHGHLVAETAKGLGFQGNLLPLMQHPGNPGEKLKLEMDMSQPELQPEQFRELLKQRVEGEYSVTLEGIGEQLGQLKEAGLHHSAVNLSLGLSEARSVTDLYQTVGQGGILYTGQGISPLTMNAARAYDLSIEKLLSADPEIGGPERARLQQGLVDDVHSALENSERFQKARAGYEQAVQSLESQHNSVVVSADNSGSALEDLKNQVGGLGVEVGSKFFDNILATPETTTVGAVHQGKVAAYSSDYAEVDLYADGTAAGSSLPDQPNARGTSFAAPRVAAVMAKLHELYPDKSSREIEAMLKEQMSEQLLSYDGKSALPTLSDPLAGQFLSRY